MRTSLLTIAILTLFALLAPLAAAAPSVTLTPPAGPIPWDATTKVPIVITAPCSQLAQDKAASKTSLEIALKGGEPPWLAWKGQMAPWDSDQCDQSSASKAATCTPAPTCASNYPEARTYGNLTFTPSNDAPAFQTIMLTVQAKGSQAGVGEASLNISVAYHGSLNASTDRDSARAGLNQSVPLNLTLEPFANGKGKIFFTLEKAPSFGSLQGLPESLDVNPPTAYFMSMAGMGDMWMAGGPGAGQPQSLIVPLSYRSSTQPWPADEVTVSVQLKSNDDPSMATTPVTIHWALGSSVVTAKKSSPGPGLEFVVLAGVAVALLRRRA